MNLEVKSDYIYITTSLHFLYLKTPLKDAYVLYHYTQKEHSVPQESFFHTKETL